MGDQLHPRGRPPVMAALVIAGYGCCLALLAVAIDQAPEVLDAVTEWLERRHP